jgi:hypothetical protein
MKLRELLAKCRAGAMSVEQLEAHLMQSYEFPDERPEILPVGRMGRLKPYRAEKVRRPGSHLCRRQTAGGGRSVSSSDDDRDRMCFGHPGDA